MTENAAITELCLLRIAVFGAMLFIDKLADADTVSLAPFPAALRSPIPAGAWIDRCFNFDGKSFSWINRIFKLACLSAAIGFLTPLSTLIASVLGLYVLAVPSRFGGVRAFHHLWWFSVVLFTTPCGITLSIDSVLGWHPRSDFPFVHALWVIRCLFALIYFFPGVWKLRRRGLLWGDTIYNATSLMWFDVGGCPHYVGRLIANKRARITIGIFVMAFEIGFPGLILFWPAAAFIAGILFHLASGALLRIPFWHLQVCYVALIPTAWLDLLVVNGVPGYNIGNPRINMWWSLNQPAEFYLVSAVLICGVAAFGIAGIRSWPFAVYPTFADGVPKTVTTLLYSVDFDEGKSSTYDVTELLAKRIARRRSMTMVNQVCRNESGRGEKLEALKWLCDNEIGRFPSAWRFIAIERPVDAPQFEVGARELLSNSTKDGPAATDGGC